MNAAPISASTRRRLVVLVLGALQILAYGTTFYLLAILAAPITRDTGWPYPHVIAGVSVGLLFAGIVSPRIGRAINARGGSQVMALCATIIALGLLAIGTAQNLLWYFGGWAIIGIGMGGGLYDTAFATLGKLYGKEARGAITGVTLLGGFASTVCWPISAVLVEDFGWRMACLSYAAVWLIVAAPLYLFAIPQARPMPPAEIAGLVHLPEDPGPHEALMFFVLASVLTVSAAILSGMGAHFVTVLQGRGLDLGTAVALGMLIGPSAVGARLVEKFAGNRYHPIWTMIASAALVAVGMCLFFTEQKLFGLAVVLYAAGNGIGSIAKGTLPLALFGPTRYPTLMGRLGLPVMVAMALMPYLGAVAYQYGGSNWTLGMILGLALTNVGLVGVLWLLSHHHRTRASS